MKKIISRIILIVIMFILMMQVKSMAAVIVSTDKQVESDSGNVTISITSKQALGAYTLKLTDAAGLTLVSASGAEGQVSSDNKTITGSSASGTTNLGSFTFKVPGVTEDKKYNIKFSITGMETPNLESVADETNTAILTVKAKVQTPTTPDTPQTPTTPTITEPKFTNADKTMYATKDCNLRASWSTSSASTSIKKGTELKVTGTSTDKVNDYVWYRVSYNGATKYIASYLLTNTKPEEEKKSDNAYLKTLTIEGQELIPAFNKETTSYTMQVTSDITELNINAEAEDEKASVSIQGNKDLKDGENKLTISVSAEDGTTKIYEITITKSEKVALGLKSLKIKDTDIASTFKTDVYKYEINVKDVTKLDIEATPSDETATIEIVGNEDLQEGENIITIIVSSKDGKEKVTYQIKANKIIAKVDTTKKQEIDPKIYLYVGIGVILLIALIIVIVYTIKHRNQEEFEYSDNFEGFPEELPERQEKEKYEENSVEENEPNIEQTQEINYNQGINYNEEKVENDEKVEPDKDEVEEQNIEDRKAKIDYFLDYTEEDEKPRRRKGKHF